jgi:hypothetical protein
LAGGWVGWGPWGVLLWKGRDVTRRRGSAGRGTAANRGVPAHAPLAPPARRRRDSLASPQLPAVQIYASQKSYQCLPTFDYVPFSKKWDPN